MSNFTRIEVIDPEGSVFSKYYDDPMCVSAAIHDDGKTVKLFVDRAEDLG